MLLSPDPLNYHNLSLSLSFPPSGEQAGLGFPSEPRKHEYMLSKLFAGNAHATRRGSPTRVSGAAAVSGQNAPRCARKRRWGRRTTAGDSGQVFTGSVAYVKTLNVAWKHREDEEIRAAFTNLIVRPEWSSSPRRQVCVTSQRKPRLAKSHQANSKRTKQAKKSPQMG